MNNEIEEKKDGYWKIKKNDDSFYGIICEMIDEDWAKFKKFVSEKRKYIFWIIMFFITISTTGILGLGSTWDEFSKQNPALQGEFLKYKGTKITTNAIESANDLNFKKDVRKMKGGDNDPPPVNRSTKPGAKPDANADKQPDANAGKKSDATAKTTNAPDANAGKKSDATAKTTNAPDATAKTTNAPDATAKTPEANTNDPNKKQDSKKKEEDAKKKEQDKKKKDIKKQKKKKGISGSPTSTFLQNGIGVFQRAFMMFATLLFIAGALSIPFLIIIIVTYNIIKMIAGHFMVF